MAHIDTSAHLNRWRKKALAEKALLALGMLLIAVSVQSWVVDLLISLIMICATLLGAGVPIGIWWRAMTAPIGFLLMAMATLVLTVGAWHIGIAPRGVTTALRLGARVFAGVNCLIFLALTTPAPDLAVGMRRLHVPSEIIELALLMYRFVFLLTDTAASMNAAQAARLGHVGYRRHMRSLGLLLVNLMPRAFARAQALEVGLSARGWRGDLRVLSPVRPASPAWLTAIAALEMVVLLIGIYTR